MRILLPEYEDTNRLYKEVFDEDPDSEFWPVAGGKTCDSNVTAELTCDSNGKADLTRNSLVASGLTCNKLATSLA